MFGFKNKRIEFSDLPDDVQSALEILEVEVMEGGDPFEILEPIVKRFPGFVPARLNLASLYLNHGDIDAARKTYQRVAKDYPDDLGAKAGLATVFAAEGNLDAAENLASEALQGGYDWPACYGVVAEAKEKRGDVQGAVETFLAGYRNSPHSWDFLEQYCRLTNRPFSPPTGDVEPCITLQQLDELATYVDEKANTPDATGTVPGCNHTLRFAEQWAAENSVDVIELYQFLNAHGGFCDCEICFNVTQLLIEAEE